MIAYWSTLISIYHMQITSQNIKSNAIAHNTKCIRFAVVKTRAIREI